MGAMGRRFLFPSCRLTGAPCEGGSWWWRRRKKLRRDGRRDLGRLGRLHGRCALCVPMNSEHSTDADRGLGRRGAGEGGGAWMVDGGEGAGLQRTARVWGRQDESYPPQLMAMGFWERLLVMASMSFCLLQKPGA